MTATLPNIVKLPHDALTRVRPTIWGKDWPFPVSYFAGSTIPKNGGKFFISHFTLGTKSGAVCASGHFVGHSKHKTCLLIGDRDCFQEKIV